MVRRARKGHLVVTAPQILDHVADGVRVPLGVCGKRREEPTVPDRALLDLGPVREQCVAVQRPQVLERVGQRVPGGRRGDVDVQLRSDRGRAVVNLRHRHDLGLIRSPVRPVLERPARRRGNDRVLERRPDTVPLFRSHVHKGRVGGRNRLVLDRGELRDGGGIVRRHRVGRGAFGRGGRTVTVGSRRRRLRLRGGRGRSIGHVIGGGTVRQGRRAGRHVPTFQRFHYRGESGERQSAEQG